MPFTYRQVKDLYDILHSSGAVSKSLPDWSSEMNTNTGGDLYNAGLNDNFIKRSSVAIDRGLEAIPGLTESSRQLGAGFGSLFGQEEAGAQIGEGLPRMVANFAPTVLGGLATGPAAPFVIGAGLAGTAALSGSQTYTDTGSPAAGVLSGITNAALPGITGKIEQGILGKIGGRLVSGSLGALDEAGIPSAVQAVSQYFPKNILQSSIANLGGQVGAAGIMEASGLGQDWLSGRPFHDVFSPETALNLTLGQLPFAALHLGAKALKLGKSPMEQANALQQRIDLTQKGLDLKAAADAVANKTPFGQLPDLTPEQRIAKSAETQAEIDARLEVLGIRRQEIEAAPTENNIEELQQIAQEEAATVQEAIDKTGGVGLGLSKANGAKLDVVGSDHFYKDSTGYHVITIADDPKNAGLVYPDGKPVQAGDRIGFPGGNYDPAVNLDSSPNFKLPKDKFTKVIDRPATRVEGQVTPELPVQAVAYDLEQLHHHVTDLEKIKQIVSSPGMTWGGAVSVLESVNTLRKELGRPEIDLASLRVAAEKQGIATADGAIKALVDETQVHANAEAEAKANLLKRIGDETKTQAEVMADAQMGDQTAQAIVDLYNQTSKESGRRGQFAVNSDSTSPFWQKVAEQRTGKGLNPKALKDAIENSASQGKGLENPKPIAKEELKGPAFVALTSEEKALRVIGAEKIIQVLAGDNSDEAKVFKQFFFNESGGALDLSKEAFAQAAVDAKVEDAGPGANLYAEEFVKNPKVIGWLKKLGQLQIENEKPQLARAPNEDRKQLPAGGGFVWGLAPYDPATNRLGDKHTLPKSGVISEQQLKAIGGRGKPLQDVEIQMMKAVDETVGGKAFEGGSVNVRKLAEVLKDNPVQVEVKKFGSAEVNHLRKVNELRHQLDTIWPDWGQDKTPPTPEATDLLKQYNTIHEGPTTIEIQNAGAKYSFLGPKSEQDMPGYVEGLVRIPTKPIPENTPSTYSDLYDAGKVDKTRGVKFTGPHFGSEDTNVLAFFRGFEDTLPDGSKAFHVIEVQSDWGQARKKAEDQLGTNTQEVGGQRPWSAEYEVKGHPLLKSYETLALKAAVDHAKSIGATKIFLSDSETAMMTEGHDKAAKATAVSISTNREPKVGDWGVTNSAGSLIVYSSKEIAEANQRQGSELRQVTEQDLKPVVSQSGGMALHYDTTLPSAMRKLTGDMGEKIYLGKHKTAITYTPRNAEGQKYGEDIVSGSPIFKDAQGNPKTQISGTLYDLTKIQGISESQGGLTLGDPARSPGFDPFIPQTDKAAAVQKALTTDGIGLMKLVSQENSPQGALARDLLTQFPSALALVKGEVHEMNGAAAHMNLADQGSSIYFGPSVVSREETGRNQTILHEVVHGLTMQLLKALPEGHPMRVSLEGIRQRAIEALPKEWRDSYNKAISEDFISQYSKTGDSELYAGLGPTPEARSIIYALLNHDEMVAQGFSEPKFQKYLQGVSGGPNLWNKFVNWTRELLGLGNRIHDNAFAELMGTTGELMQYGEYLASVQDFGERYFESKGKGGEYGKAQTQRALGLIADNANGTSPEELVNWLTKENDYRFNPGLSQTSAKLEASFSANDEVAQATSSILNEVGHDPSQRGLDDLVDTAIGEGKAIQDELDLMQPSAASYVFEKLKDHRDVLAMVQAATKAKNEGVLNIVESKLLRGPLDKAIKNIDRILKNQDRQIEFAGQLTGLQAMEPIGFAESNHKAFSPNEPTLKDKEKATPNFAMRSLRSFMGNLSWFLEPFPQMSQRIPELAEVNTYGRQQKANENKAATDSLKVLAMDKSSPHLDFLDANSLKEAQKQLLDPRLQKIVNQWIGINQIEGGDSVSMLPESHPKIAKLINNLSKEDQKIAHEGVVGQSMSIQQWHQQELTFMEREAGTRGGSVLNTERGGKAGDNISGAMELTRAMLELQDPMTQLMGENRVRAVQTKILPEHLVPLIDYLKGETDKIKLRREFFSENQAWASARRGEQFIFKYKKGQLIKPGQASSEQEARSIMEKDGGILVGQIEDQYKNAKDEPFSLDGMSPEAAQRFRELDDNGVAILVSKGIVAKEDADIARSYMTGQQAIKEATAGRGLPNVEVSTRRLTNAEELPWMWNHISYIQRQARYWSRRLLRAQGEAVTGGEELVNNPELQQIAKTHIQNLLYPDPQTTTNITRAMSTWFMGFNLATSIIETTQPFVTHVSGLTEISGKALDSYRRIGLAMDEAKTQRLTGKWASDEHDWVMKKATGDLQRSIGNHDETEMLEEGIGMGFKRLLEKNKVQTIGQRLGSMAGAYSRAAMFLKRAGENFNADIALLAGYDLYHSQGLGREEALTKAYDFNSKVNFSGGRSARAVGAYSGRSPVLRTAAMLGTAMQGYVLGTTATFGRYIQKGFFRPNGVTPNEMYAARKALLQMASTQFAAAGLLGLPFVSGAMALMDKMFPDLEVNKHVREWMNDFMSSDKENGNVFTDIAMTGMPSMLGWDMQSRLSMGNTLPGVSEVNGFQPENLMGPAANIIKNFVNGVEGWAKGDAKAGLNFLPSGARSLIKTGANLLSGEDAVRDYQGRPLSDPTVGERLGLSLGFQPKRLSDQNAASRIATQATEVLNRQKNQENQDFAGEVLKGNFGNVRQQLIARAQADKSYNPQDAVRAISRSAEEQTFPRDLRREGTVDTNKRKGQFLNSFSNLSSPPSEEVRFLFRQQIEQKLGLPPTRGGSELELARLVDRLRLAQPTASRSELQAAAQLALRRHAAAQPTLTLPME